VRKYLFDNRWVFGTGDQLDGTGIFVASISLLEGPQLAGSSYTQYQKLKFRYPLESGYRICQFLNIVYNGFRPIPDSEK
jgi:hypothetical protein